MKKSKINILILISIWSVFFACNRTTDVPDGPNLVDRFGPFAVNSNLTVSVDSVDFSDNGKVVFNAEFNKNVEWVVEIIGKESGAVKRIEGFDREVNASNAVWTGGTTNLPFFRNELCLVRLTVPEQSSYLDTALVTVIGTKEYEGFLLADFEVDDPNGVRVFDFEFDFVLDSTGRRSFVPAAQGEYYLSLTGKDIVLDNFFVGLVVISPSLVDSTYVPLPTTVPENVFFNCFLYGDGRPFTTAVIEFAFDQNNNGTFEDSRDLLFKVPDYVVDWVGWRQISHPMSATGMTQEQLGKLVAIRVLLIDTNPQGTTPTRNVSFGIDYLTFTNGKPLEL